MLGGELDQASAPGDAEGGPGGVLEGGHGVDQLGTAAGQHLLERLQLHALLVHGNPDQLGAGAAKHADRPGVGELLGDDRVAGADQGPGDQIDGLLDPVGDDQIGRPGFQAVAQQVSGQVFEKGGKALRGAQVQQIRAVVLQSVIGAIAELPHREGGLGGQAGGQRGGHGAIREQQVELAERAGLQLSRLAAPQSVEVGQRLGGRRGGGAAQTDGLGGVGGHEGSLAHAGANLAFHFKVFVGLDHGVAVDPQRAGQVASSRQPVVGAQRAVLNQPAETFLDLDVQRRAVRALDVEGHRKAPTHDGKRSAMDWSRTNRVATGVVQRSDTIRAGNVGVPVSPVPLAAPGFRGCEAALYRG